LSVLFDSSVLSVHGGYELDNKDCLYISFAFGFFRLYLIRVLSHRLGHCATLFIFSSGGVKQSSQQVLEWLNASDIVFRLWHTLH
jgi:hypothetical protein